VIAVLLSAALAAPSKKSPPEPPPEPAPVVDPEAWRSSIPGPATESTWQPPVPETFQLSNGIPVVLIERHELPLVSVRLMMRAGRETAPDQPGLPTLTADLLDEGTRERDGARFAEAAGALGANLQSGQGGEYGWVLLDALAGEPLLPSLDLMVEMLREPSFAEFDRVRQAEIDQLAAASAVPGWHAERIASSELFGKDHPYGVLPSGTAESLSSLKKGHVKKFYKSWWQPANFALVVAGDVSRADLQEALETRLGDWKAKPGKAAEVAPPTPPASTRIVFRDHPGAVQSAIRVVSPGPSRTSDGYMPTLLAATIFGGMFSSPLNMNLREQHGWAYGAYAYLAEAKDYGRFTASAAVQADKTAPSVQEILRELEKSSGAPPSAEMLSLAQDNTRKSVAGEFETNASTTAAFSTLVRYGLPLDTWRNWSQIVTGTGLDKVGQASSALDPKRQIVVVVGPRTVQGEDGQVDVVKELEALGYPVTVVP
jgi:zinc protease